MWFPFSFNPPPVGAGAPASGSENPFRARIITKNIKPQKATRSPKSAVVPRPSLLSAAALTPSFPWDMGGAAAIAVCRHGCGGSGKAFAL